MAEKKWAEEKLSLRELSLWDENARFPDKYFGKSEKELVSYFCAKSNFKILELLKQL